MFNIHSNKVTGRQNNMTLREITSTERRLS